MRVGAISLILAVALALFLETSAITVPGHYISDTVDISPDESHAIDVTIPVGNTAVLSFYMPSKVTINLAVRSGGDMIGCILDYAEFYRFQHGYCVIATPDDAVDSCVTASDHLMGPTDALVFVHTFSSWHLGDPTTEFILVSNNGLFDMHVGGTVSYSLSVPHVVYSLGRYYRFLLSWMSFDGTLRGPIPVAATVGAMAVVTFGPLVIVAYAAYAGVIAVQMVIFRKYEGKGVKARKTYLLLLLLGVTGAHRYYMGQRRIAVLYLCTCGLLFMGPVADLILLPVYLVKHSFKEHGEPTRVAYYGGKTMTDPLIGLYDAE